MDHSAAAQTARSVPRASVRDTLGALTGVILPLVSRGVIIRRPPMVALAERADLDRRAVRRMQRLRDRYDSGVLLLRIPIRRQALVLQPDAVHRVLEETPEPFATATFEKRAALAHFQPKGVLVSHGPERADRRRFNEQVLDEDRPVHRFGEQFLDVVDDEADRLLRLTRLKGTLDWDDFAPHWFAVVRRVTFGDVARDDHEITDLMAKLRAAANWAFLRPKRPALRNRLFERLGRYVERAEPGSLAAAIAATPTTEDTEPVQQIPQWLFAFDPAGMATFRALALLASHPDAAEQARAEAGDRGAWPGLPYLRACVLESLRLWPTTPAVLRETTTPTTWPAGVLPAHTHVFVFAPFFHRDDTRLPNADRFAPRLWLEDRTAGDWPLIPFSGGPAMCPGRNLVLLVSSAMLARVVELGVPRLADPARLRPDRPLPSVLNLYSMRFEW